MAAQRELGYYPSGAMGVVLLIIVILLLTGRVLTRSIAARRHEVPGANRAMTAGLR